MRVLPPKGAENFDEKTAGTAGGVGHADFGELREELIGAGKVAFLAADGDADFVHDFSRERVHQGIGHRAGDAGGRVVDALVLAVGGQEHFVALAENILVNAAVVVVDDAARGKSLIPTVDAEDEVQLLAKALEVGGGLVEPVPDAGGEDFRVVVFVEKILKLGKELGHDAVRSLGFPVLGLADVAILRVAIGHESEILNRPGKDEFVDEENDGFGGEFRRRPFDAVEFVEPYLQVREELLFQFRLLRRVFHTPDGVQHAAGFAAADQEIGERLLGERPVLKIEIPCAKKPRGAEVGENQAFVVTEIFFDLGDVLFGIGVLAPERLLAVRRNSGLSSNGTVCPIGSGRMKSTQPSPLPTWRVGWKPKTSLHSAVNKSSAADSGFAPFFKSSRYLAIGWQAENGRRSGASGRKSTRSREVSSRRAPRISV